MSTPVVSAGTLKQRTQSLGALFAICAIFVLITIGIYLITQNEFIVQGVVYIFLASTSFYIRRTTWFKERWVDVGRMDEADLKKQGLVWFDPKYLVIIGSALSLASAILGFAIQNQFDPPKTTTSTTADVIFFLLFMPILAPIIEEVFCRGILYPTMRHGFRMITSMIVVNVLFSLMHVDLYRLIPTFMIGMVVTYIYEKSRQLHNSIFIHITHNMLSIPLALITPLHHFNIIVAIVVSTILWAFVIWQIRSIMTTTSASEKSTS